MEQSLNYDSYSDADHAGTHRQLAPGPERDTAEIAADFDTLMRDGYVIIEGLLSPDAVSYTHLTLPTNREV